jgi:sigma-B regulation protein RsbU (phosphoserine phosphatase)
VEGRFLALSGSSFALEAPQENTQLRVFVVADSRLQRKILSASSERWSYRVEQAESAEDALTKYKYDPPDLVISDWMMPNMNVMKLCQAFRDMPRDNYGYFMSLTSKAEKLDVVRGLKNWCG